MGRFIKIKNFRVPSIVCILAAIIASFVYCGPAKAEDYRKMVPHISADQAFALYNTGRLFLLDVHAGTDKKRSKILGAAYIPSSLVGRKRLNLPKRKLVGVFCN